MVIGEGLLVREYINAMYDMLTAYDFLLEDAFSTPDDADFTYFLNVGSGVVTYDNKGLRY